MMISEELSKALEEKFGFSAISGFVVLKGGFSDVFSFTADDRDYFLKVYSKRGSEDIAPFLQRSIFVVRDAWFREGVPIIMPRMTEDNSSYFMVGDAFAELYDFFPQEKIFPDQSSAIFMAEALAKIHGCRPGYDSIRNFAGLMKTFDRVLASDGRLELLGLSHVLGAVRLSSQDFSFVNCHGDLKTGNLLQVDDGFFVSDFDSIIYAPPIYDLGITLSSLMQDFSLDDNCRIFLEKYCSLQALTAVEKKFLPHMIILHILEQYGGAYKKGDSAYVELNLKRLKLLVRNFDKISSVLTSWL